MQKLKQPWILVLIVVMMSLGGYLYYEKLVELHGKESKKPMYVKDIGGLECSKCHY